VFINKLEIIKMTSGFTKYMTENFPKFSISKPVFRLTNSLRFELGPEDISTSENKYFDKAIERATEITSFALKNAKTVYVIYQECTDGNEIEPNSILIDVFGSVNGSSVILPYTEDDGDKLEWRRLIKKMDSNDPLLLKLISSIIHVDFPNRSPRIEGELYFILDESNTIINIYDDRGMDVGAKSISDLKPLYERFNDWILEYDRKEIDEKFRNTISNKS
jgi:hypothetical protein